LEKKKHEICFLVEGPTTTRLCTKTGFNVHK
jgi:hypothetical protein